MGGFLSIDRSRCASASAFLIAPAPRQTAGLSTERTCDRSRHPSNHLSVPSQPADGHDFGWKLGAVHLPSLLLIKSVIKNQELNRARTPLGAQFVGVNGYPSTAPRRWPAPSSLSRDSSASLGRGCAFRMEEAGPPANLYGVATCCRGGVRNRPRAGEIRFVAPAHSLVLQSCQIIRQLSVGS